MLGGLVEASTKALGGSRFSLLNVLPATVVVTTVTVLIRAGAYSPGGPVRFDRVLPEGERDAVALALFALAALLCGILVRPFETALVQLLEGYWARPSPLAPLSGAARERHRRRRDDAAILAAAPVRRSAPVSGATLRDLAREDRRVSRAGRKRARAESIRDAYPDDDRLLHENLRRGTTDTDLMPTLLGNVLKRGERLAGDRYGLDMMVVFPRIYPYISERLHTALSRQFELITSTASLSICFALLSLATTPLVARLDAWSVAPFAAAAVSVLAYRGAVAASHGHGRLLATVFDVHRFDLAAAMHYDPGTTADEQHELNMSITEFLQPGSTRPLREEPELGAREFKHPEVPPAGSPTTDGN
ncbi:hypothetical protein OG317_20530 [Streptomyces sp. NBC_01167]|uniref:hypothetical protein n=1 Tax=Streptomyces sp. NBC_01167 TaxID=2903756 RepID=UPI0038695915|nr:hypothetical protein OG317_20530 [Streptomyces sp. NBC_01167]